MATVMTRESRAMGKHSPRAARLRLAPRGQHWPVCTQQGKHPFCVGRAVRLSCHLQIPVSSLMDQCGAAARGPMRKLALGIAQP